MRFEEPKMTAVGIIPARYNSTRLPAKPLVLLKGKSMISRVWENAKNAKTLDEVYIATDDDRIRVHCEGFGAKVIMTPPELPSGTDRIYYAYKELDLSQDVIINIQGDEPLLLGEDIDNLFNRFVISLSDVGTLVHKIDNIRDVLNPNVVKVTLRHDNVALYFSRSPIPYIRDFNLEEWQNKHQFWKHIGVYAYKTFALEKFCELPQTTLELAENLEQLRLLENGFKYQCIPIQRQLISIDRPEDVKEVEKYL
ncbi:MAG: 3-deoxy-manno-octulosonate cytidylyltransferase [Candidatus Kapaibacteriota bacterium]|jgi:3-deoxy-manno-octulosonate cytidylyltransferase (CMP-KDO synthetase)